MLMTIQLARSNAACWSDEELKRVLGEGRTLQELKSMICHSDYLWCCWVFATPLYTRMESMSLLNAYWADVLSMIYHMCKILKIKEFVTREYWDLLQEIKDKLESM